MAYWRINHGSAPMRSISSRPASYHDLMHALMLSRGIDPASLSESGAPRATRRARPASVRVVGGQLTSGMRSMADQWHTAHMPADWSRHTGSDRAAIAWALEADD